MVLAVPNLQQPVCGHAPVPAGRGPVQTHPLGLQVVHAQPLPGEGPCQGLPRLVMTQRLHYRRQPVIAEIERVDALPGTALQCVQPLCGPGYTWFSR